MITFLIFIAVIGVLVLVHEWGHFVMARKAGMRVEEFGFGFPPKIWGKKKGDTIYSINLIPFGGFVKIYGEDGGHRENPDSFGSKSFFSRFKVIVAGVVMNFMFAVVLLTFGNFFGFRVDISDPALAEKATDKRVQIIRISPDSPADLAGIMLLDEIVSFEDSAGNIAYVSETADVRGFVMKNLGKTITVTVKRGNETLAKELEPRLNPPAGEGAMGIEMSLTGLIHYPWYEAIWRGAYNAYLMTVNTIYGYGILFKTLFTTGKLLADVSGPVGIATLTGQAARVGITFLMQFVAMISVNLAVLNILPFPALDGGRALMLIIEKLKGSPLNKRAEALINTAGFALLIGLMVYVTVKDIAKFL